MRKLFMFLFICISISTNSNASDMYQICDELTRNNIINTTKMTIDYQNNTQSILNMSDVCHQIMNIQNVRLISAPIIEIFSESADKIASDTEIASWVSSGAAWAGVGVGLLSIGILFYQTRTLFKEMDSLKKEVNFIKNKPPRNLSGMIMQDDSSVSMGNSSL